MKKSLIALPAALFSASLAASVMVDGASRSVTFTGKATGLAAGETIEFFAVGPISDHDYESLIVTDDSPSAIAAAMDSVGVPRGCSPDPSKAAIWPQGPRVTIEARLKGGEFMPAEAWVNDAMPIEGEGAGILRTESRWTGGSRDGAGECIASTNMPCAVWALYNHSPSLVQLDGIFEQSVTYGRFSPKSKLPNGAEMEVRIRWDGSSNASVRDVCISKGEDLKALVGSFRDDPSSANGDLFVRLKFALDVPLGEAVLAARAFDILDGPALKMNGCADGEFFYKAFLPNEGWRDRPGRIFQPFELHIGEDGSRKFIYVEEDWSGEGLDPILRPREMPFLEWSELKPLIGGLDAAAEKITVMFIFAPSSTPMSAIRPVLGALGDRVTTFYIFESDGR